MQEEKIHELYRSDFYCNRGTSSGAMPAMHYHAHYEIFYLLSGERKHVVGDSFLTLKKGDCVVINSGVPHKTGGQRAGLRFLIAFNDVFLSKWLTQSARSVLLQFFNRPFLHPDPKHTEELLQLFNQIETAHADKNDELLFSSLLRLFFILNDSPVAQSDEKYPVQVLKQIMEYTQENYATITSLDEVAEALFISKYHICHLFSKYVEFSFINYLTNIRLKAASDMLKNTKASITEIAQRCGFNNSSYFCRVFKKHFGFSPLEYKNLQTK